MSKSKYSGPHRVLDGAEMVGYGVTSAVSGTATAAFTMASAALLMTGIGAVGAVVTLPVAIGFYALTVYSVSKTIHKAHHVVGQEHDCHSLSHVKSAFGK